MNNHRKTNVYICHRPYHVLRSCDMVEKLSDGSQNILIHFNMKKLGKNEYQDHFRFPTMEKYFDKVILMNRADCFEKSYSLKFRTFYKRKSAQYKLLIESFGKVDSVYFFSDYERPVEILVSQFKKMTPAKIILVDEGTATYFLSNWKKNRFKVYANEWISRLFGVKINSKGYGLSNLYDESYALWPELAVFRKPVNKLPAISPKIVSEMYEALSLNLCTKRVIYASSYVNTTYGVSKECEIGVLKKIQKECRLHDCELYIKPHPVQSIEYYNEFNDFICDPQIPLELLMGEDTVVISPFSSVLVNARAMGLKAICVSRLFSDSNKYEQLFSFFGKIGVEFANDMFMLSSMLK